MDVRRNAFGGAVAAVCLLVLAGARAAEIPDPLVLHSGRAVQTPEDWQVRREQMRDVLLRVQYGHLPPVPAVTVSRGERAAYQQARRVYAWLNAAQNVELYVGDYGHHDPNGPEGSDSWDTRLRFLDAHFRK